MDFKKILMSQDEKIRECTQDSELLRKVASMLNASKKVVITGEGDKFIVPMISKYLADACLGNDFEVYNARVLANYCPESIDDKTLVFFLTVRGKNIDILDAINEVKKRNSQIVVITQLEKKEKDSIYSSLKGYRNHEIIIPVKNDEFTAPSTTTSSTFLSVLNSIIIYSLEEKKSIEP